MICARFSVLNLFTWPLSHPGETLTISSTRRNGVKIEWAVAAEGIVVNDGVVEKVGKPVDATVQRLPDPDFLLPVLLAVRTEERTVGMSAPMLRYEIRNNQGSLVKERTLTIAGVSHVHDEWPPEAPAFIFAGLALRFPVDEPGAFEIDLSLDDQAPVRLVHLVLRR
jgi:hypothetical protein